MLGVPRVLIGQEHRVGYDPGECFLERRYALERIGQRCRRSAERPLELSNAGEVFLELLFRGAPRRGRRVDVRQIPLVFVMIAGAIAVLRRKRNEERKNQNRNEDATRQNGYLAGLQKR